MTTIYFIRHAEPNYENHDDGSRELTPKGLQDSQALVKSFATIPIDCFYSSPYQRALDTIKPLAESRKKDIRVIHDFRERKITDHWIENFNDFTQKQWSDFSYHLPDGESLAQVQARNIQALQNLLDQHPHQTLVIGTHGTALACILNYYQPDFLLEDFQRVKHRFPWIVKVEFQGQQYQTMVEYP